MAAQDPYRLGSATPGKTTGAGCAKVPLRQSSRRVQDGHTWNAINVSIEVPRSKWDTPYLFRLYYDGYKYV